MFIHRNFEEVTQELPRVELLLLVVVLTTIDRTFTAGT